MLLELLHTFKTFEKFLLFYDGCWDSSSGSKADFMYCKGYVCASWQQIGFEVSFRAFFELSKFDFLFKTRVPHKKGTKYCIICALFGRTQVLS